MKNHNVTLASDIIETVVLRGKKKRQYRPFDLEGVSIKLSKTLKYLGITIDKRRIFDKHIEAVTTRGEARVSNLMRLMPLEVREEVKGPAVLYSTMHNIVLYGAPILHNVSKIKKHRKLIDRAQ